MTKHDFTSNFISHAKSDQFYWEGNGQISRKTFSNGKAQYKTNKGFFAVEKIDTYSLMKVLTPFQLMKRRMCSFFIYS